MLRIEVEDNGCTFCEASGSGEDIVANAAMAIHSLYNKCPDRIKDDFKEFFTDNIDVILTDTPTAIKKIEADISGEEKIINDLEDLLNELERVLDEYKHKRN